MKTDAMMSALKGQWKDVEGGSEYTLGRQRNPSCTIYRRGKNTYDVMVDLSSGCGAKMKNDREMLFVARRIKTRPKDDALGVAKQRAFGILCELIRAREAIG